MSMRLYRVDLVHACLHLKIVYLDAQYLSYPNAPSTYACVQELVCMISGEKNQKVQARLNQVCSGVQISGAAKLAPKN
jgi:hypothetical protein